MVIWLALFVPLIVVGIVWWKWNHKILWWELLIQIGAPILFIALSKCIVETCQTSDTEYWGGYVVRAEYLEDWDERVTCRHDIYENETYTDSQGNTRTRSVYKGKEHAYDVDYHPPEWSIKTNHDGSISVGQGTFESLCQQFGNRTFVELNRNFHSNDGDMYVSDWKGEPEKLESVVTTHSYTNRVQASQSIFNYPEVDPKTYGLYDYPPVNGYKQPGILGPVGPNGTEAAKKLDYWNAVLGKPKQVKLFVLVFKNQPMQAAIEQEAFWKGGNKNEFVTCVGVDDAGEVRWCRVFSWTEVEGLKIEARNFIVGQKSLDLVAYADWLGPEVDKRWVRKLFADFNYLTVEPPLWAVILVYFLTLAVSVGVSIWVVANDVDATGSSWAGRHRVGAMKW